jgi:hypothetical protein
MRKLISIVVAALFGLGAGLGSSNVWFRVHTTPYCRVATNPDSYHGRYVRVKARVFFERGYMSVYEECDPDEALMALVEFENDNSARFVSDEKDWEAGVAVPTKVAYAIIEGRFDAHNSWGCYTPRYRIDARKIELITDLRDVSRD